MSSRAARIILLAVVVAIAALVWALAIARRAPRPTREALATRIEKIDEDTLETVTLSLGDWQNLGQRNGRFRNPKTGKYTMLPVMTCASCGAKIPNPLPMWGETPQTDEEMSRTRQEFARVMAEYRCPRCGKNPFSGGPTGQR